MTSTVTCDYINYNWELNARGENACQVYAQLQGQCDPSESVRDAEDSTDIVLAFVINQALNSTYVFFRRSIFDLIHSQHASIRSTKQSLWL